MRGTRSTGWATRSRTTTTLYVRCVNITSCIFFSASCASSRALTLPILSRLDLYALPATRCKSWRWEHGPRARCVVKTARSQRLHCLRLQNLEVLRSTIARLLLRSPNSADGITVGVGLGNVARAKKNAPGVLCARTALRSPSGRDVNAFSAVLPGGLHNGFAAKRTSFWSFHGPLCLPPSRQLSFPSTAICSTSPADA